MYKYFYTVFYSADDYSFRISYQHKKKKKSVEDTDHYGFPIGKQFCKFSRDNPGNFPAKFTVITLIDCSFLNHVYDWTVYTYWYLIIASESNRSGVLEFKVCPRTDSGYSLLFTVYKEIPNIWV